MNLQVALLHLHSVLRWVVLILLVWAIVKSIGAKGRHFTPGHRKAGLFLLIAADVELLIGLGLYFTSGYGFKAIQQMGLAAVMKDPVSRFFAVEHISMMLLSVILIHIGYSNSKRNVADDKKHRRVALFYTLALIIILAAIPWAFRLLGQGRGWI